MDWFLYDNGPRHERVNQVSNDHIIAMNFIWIKFAHNIFNALCREVNKQEWLYSVIRENSEGNVLVL